jgi:hypothetical protein
MANIDVCPNVWSVEDIFDNEYDLTVTLTDEVERIATTTLSVRPGCALEQVLAVPDWSAEALLAECLCFCAAGYVTGGDCSD